MKKLLLAVAALLAGCRSYDLSDQQASISSLGSNPIDRDLSTVVHGESMKLIPSDYLRKFTASIFADPNPANPSPPSVTSELDVEGRWTLLLAEDWGQSDQVGSAAAIAEDGYFLTASHVVEGKFTWIVFIDQIEDRPNPEIRRIERTINVAPVRIVFSSKKADFAIIKAGFDKEIKEHLEIRREPVGKDELLFSGGWINATGAGHRLSSILYDRTIRIDGFEFQEIKSSIPVLAGDSGSPVVDQSGRLCGITKAGGASRFTSSRFSLAVMLDPSEILRVIDSDRNASRPRQAMAAMAPILEL